MRHIFASLVCSIALASAPLMADTSIHKWVDSNGVTHFGAEPPKNIKSQEVKPLIYSSGTTSAPAPEAAPEAKPEDPSKDNSTAEKPKEKILTISAEQIAAQCQNAQSRLQQLEASPRLMTQTPDGQMQRVPEEERQKMMDDERARIKEYCE